MKKKVPLAEKIRVIHVITKLELGGAQINTIFTYQNLDDSRFQAYLICGPGGILNGNVDKGATFIQVKSLVREIHPFKDILALLALRRQFKQISPHVVHTHSSKAGILGRLAAFLARVPVIIHSVHGFSFSPYQSVAKRNLFTVAEKIVMRITHHFIFVAKDDVNIAFRHRLIKDNYSLIRSGFPLAKFAVNSGDKAELRKRFGLNENQIVCGIIAPFKPQKGLFHLIDIAQKVVEQEKKVVFFLAGDGALRRQLEAEITERNLRQYFRMPGFLFDLENVLDLFDVGVSTALWEGLPQSLVQMRLKKIPAVVHDIAGNREVIKSGLNGYLVKVDDHVGFARHIVHLIRNPADRYKLGNYRDRFDEWDASIMVKQQENLYLDLLQAR